MLKNDMISADIEAQYDYVSFVPFVELRVSQKTIQMYFNGWLLFWYQFKSQEWGEREGGVWGWLVEGESSRSFPHPLGGIQLSLFQFTYLRFECTFVNTLCFYLLQCLKFHSKLAQAHYHRYAKVSNRTLMVLEFEYLKVCGNNITAQQEMTQVSICFIYFIICKYL